MYLGPAFFNLLNPMPYDTVQPVEHEHQLKPGTEILFTRQRHEAERMGLHWDYRLVVGNLAYSWATKKPMPEPGKSIVLFEQPVHDREYALSPKVIIPTGSYGAGVTYLDFVRKAKIGDTSTQKQMTIVTNDGEKYLLKHIPDTKWGDKAWLFRNLGTTGNKYLEKAAKASPKKKNESELQPHQARALKKLDEEGGLVVNHSTGSGKTRLMLEAIQRAQKEDRNARVFMTAPASLLHNVDKEIKKHNLPIDRKRLDLYSFQKATRDANKIRKNKYALAVVDEAHGLRNEGTQRTKELREIIENSDKRLLATATSNYNAISDMSTLINIAAADKVLPESKRDMYDKYVETYKKPRGVISAVLRHPAAEGQRLTNKKKLQKVLDQYVDYYDTKDSAEGRKHFPRKTQETIETEMSPEQMRYYKYVEGDLPLLLKFKIRHNMSLDKKEKASLNSFSTGVRQASNSFRHLHQNPDQIPYTPKIEKAVSKLQESMKSNPRHKALVYSNYLDAGLKEYSKKLTDLKINHAVYSGELSKEEKHKLVEEYNTGKTPVLLISSSGSEGLDTKGTRQIQILEPHFNKSKIKQVVGRGVRFNSHEHLPETEREVHVEHYLSTYPKHHFGKTPYSIDKYLSENAEDKDELFDEVNALMRKNNE